jgi:hypothetical protein
MSLVYAHRLGKRVFLYMSLNHIAMGALMLGATQTAPKADLAWVQKNGGLTGTAYARVDGGAMPIANDVWRVWLTEGGTAVVYSSTDGAGGFENEGQSLYRFDLANRERKKLMAEAYMIDRVEEARSARGRLALLVQMSDGGLGAPHVAIVNPTRGQVYRRQAAALAGTERGIVRVADYRFSDIEWHGPGKAKPYRHLRINLDTVLAAPLVQPSRR